ncbi:urease subunit beta, partial [Staphylococcus aureus]
HPEAVVEVENHGDPPIEVGSPVHLYEDIAALDHEREPAYGCLLYTSPGPG